MQALFWMLQREKGVVDEAGSAVANANANDGNLWEKHPFADGTCFFFCPMFRMATLENPSELYRMYGGIIADEMGLGKTITMLSLLLVNRGKEGEVIEKKSEVIEKKGEVIEKKGEVIEKKGEVIEKKGEVIEKKGEVIEKKSEREKGEEEKSEMEKNGELNQTTSTNDTAKASREKNSKPQKRRNKPWEKEESTELAPSLSLPKHFTGGTLIICPLSLLFTASLSCNPHL